MSEDKSFLILGGAGLVGLQIARCIADDQTLSPSKIVIASLYKEEVDDALDGLRKMFGNKPIEFVGVVGDVFVREEFTLQPRGKLLESYMTRDKLFEDLFGNIDDAYSHSRLVKIIQEYRPNVIVDAINTATAISYQDIYTATITAKQQIDQLFDKVSSQNTDGARELWKKSERSFETLVLSQSIPQLIRHLLLLNRAMREVGTRLYLKIGTTGTGGMGLNIPYTHGEDKPSPVLMTKTSVAFAHTGLLFLMARTTGGPIVKEIKPGAMIGYADVTCRTIQKHGQPIILYENHTMPLDEKLIIRLDKANFNSLGELDLPVVDTGENGLFTRGEFEAITALWQMEFMTPEEIALEAVLEIKGSNTGSDVIAAIDSAVMNPSYRAGYLRQQALDELNRLEKETNTHSIALGILGPPELSKLLWEAELLRIEYRTLKEVLNHTPEEIANAISLRLQQDPKLLNAVTSIGVPILMSDGKRIIRGPYINIPEIPGTNEVTMTENDVEKWTAKGWVDMRPTNFAHWQDRFRQMERMRQRVRGRGSAAITKEAYLFDDIRIGTIVGWIFNNEEEGYRIK